MEVDEADEGDRRDEERRDYDQERVAGDEATVPEDKRRFLLVCFNVNTGWSGNLSKWYCKQIS